LPVLDGPILVADTDRNIIDCNAAFTELFGYSLAEIKGQKSCAVYHNPDEFRQMGEEIRKNIHTPNFLFTINYCKKSGEIFPGEINVFYLKSIYNQITGYIGIIRDVSQREQDKAEKDRLEMQLRQAQKMEAIGRLAGGVAHDFNNLLTTITGNAQLGLMELARDHELYEMLEEIKEAGDRAGNLTRQLLAFSRRQILHPEILDLNDLILDLKKMLHRLIGEDILFETLLASNLGCVEADPGQMEQVILNLAVNARDAMPDGGKLTIETADVQLDQSYAERHGHLIVPGPYVLLAVSDSGAGMSLEVQDHIFEPFFTTKEKDKGTGLGLSTVYGIVKQSNGNIWVYSEQGRGTTFKIYLPRAGKEKSGQPTKPLMQAELEGSETILVVEDDPSVRKIAVKNLTRYGYSVLSASTPAEAITLCTEQKTYIDLVLTDVVMPGMSGKELAHALWEHGVQTKVVYMSGYTEDAIVHHGVLDPGLIFLQKPFSPESLARKVREALDQLAE
jgi:PAS domain S-box-containing protein